MINVAAAQFATIETLNMMVERAKKRGVETTADEIMTTIVTDPKGNTAKFFEEHMKLAYKVAIETANKEVK